MALKRAPKDCPQRTLHHFTPLRYPGGKGKMAQFVKDIIELNALSDGEYVEPYAGGAGIALELLFHEYVSRIHINDVSRPVHAFWNSVLSETEALVKRIRTAKLSIAMWDRQKKILKNADDHDDLELGFATFYLNRTNRSGILNGGIIGGRDQSGPWGIDARYNRDELAYRVERIATLRNRIKLTRKDAIAFMRNGIEKWPAKTLIYLDPPYYVNGRQLYLDYYGDDDHRKVAQFVQQKIFDQSWIVSYDDVPAIRSMYNGVRRLQYGLNYSARESRDGNEVMFFGPRLSVPVPSGSMRVA